MEVVEGQSASSAATLAVELINEAKLTTDKPRKLEVLATLNELFIKKEPSLLSNIELLNGVFELEQDSLVDVKKWSAGFIESASKADPTCLPHAMPALQRLASESNITVQKRIMQAVAVIMPILLEHLGSFTGPLPPAWSKTWSEMQQLKAKCLNMMDSTNVGVAAQAFNCAQSIVLALSNDSIRIASISAEFLRQDAGLVLDRMLRKLTAQLPASSMTALINSLAQVAKLRTVLIAPVVDGLTALLDNIPQSLSDTQQKSIDHNLRQSLSAIQRLRIPGPWNDKISSVLSGKHRAANKRTFSEMAPSELTDDMDTAQAAKRQKLSDEGSQGPQQLSPSGIAISPTTFLAPAHIDAAMLALLTTLPLDVVMNFVLENLAAVPASLTPATPAMAGASEQPAGAADAMQVDQTANKDAEALIKSSLEKVEAAIQPEKPSGPPPSTLPPAPQMALSSAVARCTRYISRMRHGNLASVHAAESLYLCDAVIARLASLLPLEDPSVDLLFDYISMHLHNGTAGSSTHAKQVLMFWLNREFLNANTVPLAEPSTHEPSQTADGDQMQVDSIGSSDGSNASPTAAAPAMSRYEKIVEQVMTTLVSRIEPTNKTFPTIVLELPALTEVVFQQLKKYCEEPQRLAMALAALKELLMYRPPVRQRCLQMLLPLTSHVMEIIRTSTIKLATSLFTLEPFANAIVGHALELIETVCIKSEEEAAQDVVMSNTEVATATDAVVKEEPSTETAAPKPPAPAKASAPQQQQLSEDEIRRRLLLCFALCSKRHDLLHDIVDLYVRCNSSNVRKVIHGEAPPLIRAIGQASPAITAVVSAFPKGAETFILQILHVLTESTPPLPQLVELGMKAFQEYQDARFIIPVLPGLSTADVVACLPKLIMLPPTVVKAQVFPKLLHFKPSPISPAELMVQLHVIDIKKHDISLKKIIEITQMLFEDTRAIVKQDVLAAVLQQLSDITPLPTLFMRTVIQTVARIKTMGNFVVGILSRLIMKQVWNDPKIWEGFVTCLKMMMPQSISILLQLPPVQFEQVLSKHTDLRDKVAQAQARGQIMIPKTLHQILVNLMPAPEPAPEAPAASGPDDVPYDPEMEEDGPVVSVNV